MSHCPTSEWVSELSERAKKWAQRSARSKWVVWSKWTSERCELTSNQTSEWPSTTVCILDCSGPQCSRVSSSHSTDRTLQWMLDSVQWMGGGGGERERRSAKRLQVLFIIDVFANVTSGAGFYRIRTLLSGLPMCLSYLTFLAIQHIITMRKFLPGLESIAN